MFNLSIFRKTALRKKEEHELNYWRRTKQQRGGLKNDHYEPFYTSFFGVDRSFYAGKAIADIGCGPRGSLEWAPKDCETVGIDPLADRYRELGTAGHRMKYVNSGAEAIPFPDGYFGAVFSFNNLDHVENVESAVAEIRRVLAPNGLFLLIVEINHQPTTAEPHTLTASIVEAFGMEVEDRRFYRPKPGRRGAYETLGDESNRAEDDGTPLWLVAKMWKR